MLVGLFLSMLNHPYFKQSPTRKRVGFHSFLTSHDLWLDFIPQLLFLGGMFGYMALLIMLKWAQNWDGKIAPNLIGAMINMMLAPSTLADVEVYANQLQVQQVLVVLAVIAVPWMLFVRVRCFVIIKLMFSQLLRITSANASKLGPNCMVVMKACTDLNVIQLPMTQHGLSLNIQWRVMLKKITNHLVTYLFIALFMSSNSSSDVSHTLHHICVCGPYHWLMLNYPRCSGTWCLELDLEVVTS